jgi:adenosylcobinamide-GDP ribazoletransferase
MSDESSHDPEGRPDPDASPDVLAAWTRATTTVAAVFMRPPLVLMGGDPAPPTRGAIAAATRGFPIVGLIIGAGAGLALLFARALGLTPELAAIIAVAVAAWGGGALGESGLARSADALAAGGGRAGVLAAMRRRSHGTYGIIVLVAVIALKIWALAALGGTAAAIAALVAAAAVSRCAIPALLRTMSPARDHGLAADAGRPERNETILALALGAAVTLLLLGPLTGFVALMVGAAGAYKFYFLGNRLTGGVTGALLGAAQQGAEVGVLLAVVAMR